jgi:hypothetical protein
MRDDEKTASTIIPALAGWEFAVYIESSGDRAGCITCEPIVAWDIERAEGPYHPGARGRSGERWVARQLSPITVGCTDVEHLGNQWAIKRPDGKFQVPGEGAFDTEGELLAYFAEQAAKKNQRRRREIETGS